MKPHVSQLLIATLLLALTHCLVTSKSVDKEVAPSQYPCPPPEDIYPCRCGVITYYKFPHLDCSDVTSDEQLSAIFKADFPVKRIFKFDIYDNEAITKLGNDLTTLTFVFIDVRRTSLQYVSEHFLRTNADSLQYLHIQQSQLSENSFPFYTVEFLTQLTELILQGNKFTYIPYVKSASLTAIALNNNSMNRIDPGTFSNLPHLMYMGLYGNSIVELQSGSLTIPPSLYTLRLESSGITTVHPDAFVDTAQDGEAKKDLTVYLERNLITTLDIVAFQSLFDRSQGIKLTGNPLSCGCDMAWIVTNSTYLGKIDSTATCEDGTTIQNLDPSVFEQSC